ncbi:reduction in Cnn dots 4 [Musca autumnalis]|uniref:reduction in Cnn dots 4 n=1 Tax=Musca autumnalis TaxID=221902 RepID=UPI003CEB88A3
MEKPKLYTTLRQMRQAEKLQNQKPPSSAGANIPSLPSETTKKLNFGVTYNVFRNLLPINVNDSILPPQQQPTSSRINKVTKNVDTSLQPDLRDYLKPMPPLTHFVPEPELSLQFDYSRGFNVYEHLD